MDNFFCSTNQLGFCYKMLVCSISFNQKDEIIFKFQVALIVDIEVLTSGSRHVDGSEELKVKVVLK